MRIQFTKMQAFGNDYVYIDAIHQELPNLNKLAQYVSDRHFAIGSDGLILICPSTPLAAGNGQTVADFRMRVFNPDGTEGEMCGNALRSVSKYVYDHKLTDKTEFTIETLGGIQHVWLTVKNGLAVNIRADIGTPVLDTGKIPVITELPEFIHQPVKVLDRTFHITAVSWGNPHIVAFVENTSDLDVALYGPALENMTSLFPNRTNVTFAQIVNRNYIKIREWERGTGETIGCGTGCCTAVVGSILQNYVDRDVTVEQIGGPLHVIWSEETGHVTMEGPSHTMFEASIEVTEEILQEYLTRKERMA